MKIFLGTFVQNMIKGTLLVALLVIELLVNLGKIPQYIFIIYIPFIFTYLSLIDILLYKQDPKPEKLKKIRLRILFYSIFSIIYVVLYLIFYYR